MSQNKRYIPLNAGESAVLPDANTLLPRDEVYEPLAQMIIDAVKKVEAAKNKTLNELREHNAISIDGARGTGKTAVLVNLKSYLKDRDVLKDVHILDPVDPTLLEDGDSLFLHIIVAAVLHDRDIKEAQKKDPGKARSLNQTLEKLAQSLESVETQKDWHGMDKVRAMYSNKQLADCVQDFFRNVLELLGKKLLVLPIDDVDTALNRAFENLEIVRRYLATPYVLPIVCGDRSLYDEVTWRDFHGRLIEDSSYRREEAYERAVELAAEYQRKILPFPRRLTMPEVSSYWQQVDIYLRDGHAELMPLRNFIAWLEIFLAGPVNGLEGSRLLLPIPSIRALSQLVRHFSGFISELPVAVRESKEELEVQYNWQMPSVPLDKAARYKRNQFAQNLAGYFCFEPKAGAAYLVLLAKLYWQNWSDVHSSARRRSFLDTPLFQPLAHAAASFELFDKVDDLSIWPTLLAERLPEEWLAGIKSQKTILPYPVAEIGVNSSKGWGYAKKIQQLEIGGLDDNKKNKASFLIALLVQHNFYTNAKQTMLLNIGRIFELLIASIAGSLSVEDVHAILGRAPFFSAAALAPTKTILIDASAGEDDASDADFDEGHDSSELILELCEEINAWRAAHNVDQIDLSPWLVYKVFNKVYSQVASSEKVPKGMRDIGRALNMVAHTFYATWFAFGSFEKGELFELPNVIATTNINPERLKNYKGNDQFNVNVKPFLDASKDGNSMRVVSYVMAEHPLKKWVDSLIVLEWPIADNKKSDVDATLVRELNKNMPKTAREWFISKFNLAPSTRLMPNVIRAALEGCSASEGRDLIKEMQRSYSNSRNEDTVFNIKWEIERKFPEIK
ncbi:antiviral RADAR system adenosine triphosphatase RdrA [Chromobacterium aquaticum]|uniref:Antiviral RADAR system adenosine triphosphatase RdrA n=1 Tax=Chromobacterium aquaticum TaxID=467180 RepID=A0ABV9A090_9NEIS|nr:antiviral RADAR system adenosine triphosphatase RdrA [Chromobacterium aquaticum]MCD5362478.1 KAP family NTPase [Chromobacterium aquaticum]